eukprot:6450360-Karenia_brevis.AAC.1
MGFHQCFNSDRWISYHHHRSISQRASRQLEILPSQVSCKLMAKNIIYVSSHQLFGKQIEVRPSLSELRPLNFI